MRTILIIMGRYLPGYKDGGPLRSIKNLTDRLGDEYDFRILTTDRDHGDAVPYPDIQHRTWNQVGKTRVWYVEPGGFTAELIQEKADMADVVYVCGCFNDYARTTLKLKKDGKITKKVVIAPMGLFDAGAFHIKYHKKQIYITLLKVLGMFKHVEWSATNEQEIIDVKRVIGNNAQCHLAEDIPRQLEKDRNPVSKQDVLKVVFLSRISPKKNLKYAIEILKNVTEKVEFDIYGPNSETKYFEECLKSARELPQNITVSYCGEVPTEQVPEVFARYQVFLFPTLGENYGHVIYEAMAEGCIPIISDRTPWKQIDDVKAGKIIPLENKKQFTETIQWLAELSPEEFLEWQRRAMNFARQYGESVNCNGYRKIFG